MEANNMAKMHETLEWLRDNGVVCTDGGLHFRDSEEALSRIRAALVTPPRNCDRFETYFKAKHAWENVCKAGLPEQGPFDEWSFAPATEQKGESDGSK